MRYSGVAACFALLLLQPAFAAEDTSIMVIDAGRLGVMMDQSQRILQLPDDPPGDGNTETFAILRSAVMQYERLIPIACTRQAVGPELCGAIYRPAWLEDGTAPTPEVLRARIDEATDRVAPLWNALCDRLPAEHDPSLCQME